MYGLGGRVVNEETQETIAGAQVRLEGSAMMLETVTDGTGRFLFFGLEPGTYTLVVQATGFEAARLPALVASMDTNSTVIRLRPAREPSRASSQPEVSVRQLQVPAKARKAFEKGCAELYEKNKPRESVVHFRKALDIYPDYDEAYVHLGMAYFMLEQLDDAHQALERANHIYSSNARAHALLGKVLIRQERHLEGIRQLSEAVRLDDSAWDAHLDLGHALLRAGRVEEAHECARRVHQLGPSSMRTHLLYYNTLAERGDYTAALEEMDEFVRLYPDTAAASRMRSLREQLVEAARAGDNK
jgi:Flp pilus assembly protein TadD